MVSLQARFACSWKPVPTHLPLLCIWFQALTLVCGRTGELTHRCCVSLPNNGVLVGWGEPSWQGCCKTKEPLFPNFWRLTATRQRRCGSWPSSAVLVQARETFSGLAECFHALCLPWKASRCLQAKQLSKSLLGRASLVGLQERRFLPRYTRFPYFQGWPPWWVHKLGTLVQSGYEKRSLLCASRSVLRQDAAGPWTVPVCLQGQDLSFSSGRARPEIPDWSVQPPPFPDSSLQHCFCYQSAIYAHLRQRGQYG